jgi:C-terminal processing protease CtpA/Prc
MDVPANGGPAGVGITFEPKHQPGTKTHGMHVITKIRPNSPAHKSCRIQVGDILALIQQAGDPKSYSTAGMPIAKVLAMLTGPAGTGVKLHILDGQFPYLPPKIVVCTREIVPTGITQTQNKVASPVPVTTQLVPGTSSVPIYGSSAPMRSAAPMMRSAVPMDPAYGSARPFGSAAPGYVGRYPE